MQAAEIGRAETLFSCKGIGHYINTLVPCLIRRVQGDRARFVAVYDLSGKSDYVTAVQTPEGVDPQVIVQTKGGPWSIQFSKKGVQCKPPAK